MSIFVKYILSISIFLSATINKYKAIKRMNNNFMGVIIFV